MEKSVSAADANRKFSKLMQGVRKGRSYLVTSHGLPVAKLVPASQDPATEAGARPALPARLTSQPPANSANPRKRCTPKKLNEHGKEEPPRPQNPCRSHVAEALDPR